MIDTKYGQKNDMIKKTCARVKFQWNWSKNYCVQVIDSFVSERFICFLSSSSSSSPVVVLHDIFVCLSLSCFNKLLTLEWVLLLALEMGFYVILLANIFHPVWTYTLGCPFFQKFCTIRQYHLLSHTLPHATSDSTRKCGFLYVKWIVSLLFWAPQAFCSVVVGFERFFIRENYKVPEVHWQSWIRVRILWFVANFSFLSFFAKATHTHADLCWTHRQ